MSVLFKNGNILANSIAGGMSEGFPPADVQIIEYITSDGTISVKWKDPDNTVVDGVTLATWAGTILIRNDNHYPNSLDDGVVVINSTTKNAYQNTYFNDVGLTNDHAYYYRFFPYSTEEVYNDSSNLVFTKICGAIGEPVFADNTWEQINECIEKDNIPSTWQIGDKKSVKINNRYDIDFQIWAFDHFDKADGSGKAKIVLGMTKSYRESQMNTTAAQKKGGYKNSYMNNTTMNTMLNELPTDLRNVIKEVTIEYNKLTYDSLYGNIAEILTMNAKIFIPCTTELGYPKSYGDFGTKFPYFTSPSLRPMGFVGNSSNKEYWTRTCSSETGFYYIPTFSTTSFYPVGQSESYYIIACICI